jgi:hypothetical protein
MSVGSQHQEWAEHQLVVRELHSKHKTTSLAEQEEEYELVEHASRVFRYFRDTVGNPRYEVFWAAVVVVNTLTMVLEEEWTGIRSGHRIGVYETYGSDEYMDKWWPSARAAFFAIDCVFCVMFTVELILTFTYDIWNARLGFGVHFRHPFWKNPWDWLDLLIVASSNLALVVGLSDGPMSKARFFRIFRLVRLLRLMRLVRKVNSLDPLHLMTTSIRGSMGGLLWSMVLLFLIQTMFAMILTQVLRAGWMSEESSPLSEDAQVQLFRYFGTYTRSVVTMFELMLANWTPVCRFLMEDVHEVFGGLVVAYKLTVGFAVVGVINGVFIQETFSVAQNDEFIMVRSRIRQMEHHRQSVSRLFRMGDKDKSDTLAREELNYLLQKPSIRTWLEAMDLRYSDPDMLFTLIAGDGNEVTIDDFIAGVGRLRGTARNIDVICVLDSLRQHQKSVEEDLQLLMRDIKRSSSEASRSAFSNAD